MRLCIIGFIIVLSLKLTSSSPPEEVQMKIEQLKLQIKEKLAKVHDYTQPPPTPNEEKITPILKRQPKKLKLKAIKRYRKRTMEKYQDQVRKIKQQQAAFDSIEPSTTTDVNSLDTFREFNTTSTVKVDDKIVPIIENTTNELNVRKIGGRKSIMYNYYVHLNEFKCKENKWVLCHGLITPFLIGQKNNTAEHTFKTSEDNYVFKRLMLLLKLSVEAETKDERKAVLIQINKINLKLYLWDAQSITLLLKKLIKKGGKHTFKNLKAAVKYLIKKWDMNIDDTKRLKRSIKIYRPPCVMQGYEASTQHPNLYHHYETTTEDAKTEEDSGCLKDVEESSDEGKKWHPKEEHCDKNKMKEEMLRAQQYLDEDDSEEGIALDIE